MDDVPLGLAHRLMGRAPGPEAVAVFGESGLEQALQDLQGRLLHEPIEYGGNAELAFAANPA